MMISKISIATRSRWEILLVDDEHLVMPGTYASDIGLVKAVHGLVHNS